MTTSNDPDQIRAEIERTRNQISDDVNALTYEANPMTQVDRQVDKVKSKAQDFKERLFGDPDAYEPGLTDKAADRLGDAKDSVVSTLTDGVDSARQAVATAPETAKKATRGNPWAMGLVAFGLGALAGSLIPASQKERQLATQAKDAAQPLLDDAQQAASQLVSDLKPQAQEALESVKGTVQESADSLKDHAQEAADDVKQVASTEADNVKQTAQSEADNVKQTAQSEADTVKDTAQSEAGAVTDQAKGSADQLRHDA